MPCDDFQRGSTFLLILTSYVPVSGLELSRVNAYSDSSFQLCVPVRQTRTRNSHPLTPLTPRTILSLDGPSPSRPIDHISRSCHATTSRNSTNRYFLFLKRCNFLIIWVRPSSPNLRKPISERIRFKRSINLTATNVPRVSTSHEHFLSQICQHAQCPCAYRE